MTATEPASTAGHLREEWLRDLVRGLAGIERESGSPGEREAADWVLSRLEAEGAEGEIETELLHSTYWWLLGLAGAAGVLGARAALRGHRIAGAVLGAAGTYAAATDMPPGR